MHNYNFQFLFNWPSLPSYPELLEVGRGSPKRTFGNNFKAALQTECPSWHLIKSVKALRKLKGWWHYRKSAIRSHSFLINWLPMQGTLHASSLTLVPKVKTKNRQKCYKWIFIKGIRTMTNRQDLALLHFLLQLFFHLWQFLFKRWFLLTHNQQCTSLPHLVTLHPQSI